MSRKDNIKRWIRKVWKDESYYPDSPKKLKRWGRHGLNWLKSNDLPFRKGFGLEPRFGQEWYKKLNYEDLPDVLKRQVDNSNLCKDDLYSQSVKSL